ncbi:hypothetical protein OIU76_000570 [Salix suchowensis]|nr:hypothetical protein OIU76_000570 [Salix suchowensis]
METVREQVPVLVRARIIVRVLFLSRSQTYAMLKQQMKVAAQSEDYEEAARIRDSLKSFEEEEPVLRLHRLLKEAIADEQFEVTVCGISFSNLNVMYFIYYIAGFSFCVFFRPL